jgi:hypothetical protein
MLHFEACMLRFEPFMLHFEACMLRFEPFMLHFEALMLLFRTVHGAFRSDDGAISHHARCVSKHECSVSKRRRLALSEIAVTLPPEALADLMELTLEKEMITGSTVAEMDEHGDIARGGSPRDWRSNASGVP